jgi:hypothetical protein
MFKQFRWCIQHAMVRPWKHTHLHEFEYQLPSPYLSRALEILPEGLLAGREEYGELPVQPPGMSPREQSKAISETKTKLRDIYDPESRKRIRDLVLDENGDVLPLLYMYDLGVRASMPSQI